VAGAAAGFNYALTVDNNGPSDQTGGLTVTDTLPGDLTFQAAGSDSGCSASGQIVTCISSSTLPVGLTRSFNVHVSLASTTDSGVTLNNTASVQSNGTVDGVPGNNTSNTVDTTVTEDVQVTISKTFDSATAKAGTSGHAFTISVTNSGASDADHVTVSDIVDSRLTVTAVASGDFACGAVSQTINCTLAHLAAGSTKSVTVTYSVGPVNAATVSNTASVTSDEVPAKPATASVAIIQRETSTTVNCSPANVVVNQATQCTATVTDTDIGTKYSPTGSVTFTGSGGQGTFSAGSCALTAPTGTSSSCTVTYTPTGASGPRTIVASYDASGLHRASSGSATVQVNKRATTTSINCVPLVNSINTTSTCTATVVDIEAAGSKLAPAGTVTFTKDGLPAGSCGLVASASKLDTSACSVTLTSTSAAVYVMVASYSGSTVHLASTSSTLPVVFYDPSAGFVTGGGYINHIAGMYPTGAPDKANFGFVAQYKRGATIPTGETEFQYKPAGINFHSTSYDYLVVNATKAQYQGLGTVNRVAGYSFQVSVNDGGNIDTFHIKIWNTLSGVVVYDNEPANAFGTATTISSGGNIMVHK